MTTYTRILATVAVLALVVIAGALGAIAKQSSDMNQTLHRSCILKPLSLKGDVLCPLIMRGGSGSLSTGFSGGGF